MEGATGKGPSSVRKKKELFCSLVGRTANRPPGKHGFDSASISCTSRPRKKKLLSSSDAENNYCMSDFFQNLSHGRRVPRKSLTFQLANRDGWVKKKKVRQKRTRFSGQMRGRGRPMCNRKRGAEKKRLTEPPPPPYGSVERRGGPRKAYSLGSFRPSRGTKKKLSHSKKVNS